MIGTRLTYMDKADTVRPGTVVAVNADGSLVVEPDFPEIAHAAGERPRQRRVLIKDRIENGVLLGTSVTYQESQ